MPHSHGKWYFLCVTMALESPLIRCSASLALYRAEDELTRQTKGTGIGLALVKVLATKMHASVNLHNRHPGAEFQLILPTVI